MILSYQPRDPLRQNRHPWLLAGAILLIAITGCSRTATPSPANSPLAIAPATQSPGWKKIEGNRATLWLPDSYEGGDVSQNLDAIVAKLKSFGPEFDSVGQQIRQDPAAIDLFAFDAKSGNPGTLTNVNVIPGASDLTVEKYINALGQQLPKQFRLVDRQIVTLKGDRVGRMVTEFTLIGKTGKQLIYIIKDSNTIWTVSFTTSTSEFAQRLQTFEQSIRTFSARS